MMFWYLDCLWFLSDGVGGDVLEMRKEGTSVGVDSSAEGRPYVSDARRKADGSAQWSATVGRGSKLRRAKDVSGHHWEVVKRQIGRSFEVSSLASRRTRPNRGGQGSGDGGANLPD